MDWKYVKKRYKGEFKDGKPDGQGILYYKNKKKCYEGKWKEGKKAISLCVKSVTDGFLNLTI